MCLKDNNGTWIKGFSWTHGYTTLTTNPDGSIDSMRVHGGMFYWNTFNLWQGRYVEFYAGFRPTPTWSPNYGNEGIFKKVSQWLKRHGWGNLGFSFRPKRSGVWKIQ